MDESTTLPIAGPMPGSHDVLTDLLRRRGPAAARRGHRGRGRRLDRRPRPPQGRRRATPGRPQRLPARADHPDRPRATSRSSSPGSTTAGPPTQREKFTSAILPPYLRRTRSLEELIPWLYLKGVSTGDFSEALAGPARPRRPGALGHDGHPAQGDLGGRVRGLEQAVPGGQALRLRLGRRRPLQHPAGGGPPVHPGADGGHRRRPEGADRRGRRLPGERAVLEGAAPGLQGPGPGRSSRRWRSATGRWASGRRSARSGPRPEAQRCWVHKTANVLDKLPKGVQPKAKAALARHLRGRGPGGGREGVRPVRGDLRGEVPEGDRSAWRRTGRRCWRSTTSRPSTGGTSGRPTRSSRRSPRCGCGR